ncbi:NAD-dependent epimerase/dehydratase family protein [Tessaracoccus palaemonis]|uniref:NAD-dependent epimerase/dehydratase family protein n=1 Tax=Tessaracoccus palaemonis TaxID=2829499 RepID=A0ABX8SKV6_9ACTN|nr:NAD-dependent epimerase/dehydratase family protein [Tessaracoccus palaemonis]QXT64021.1 NAD-dependent epimerase/dehydratase family protein [Tessaracoccus palaemonis]
MSEHEGATRATVLVTGGSGFIAGHCILRLAASGFRIRATLRSLAKEEAVRASLESAGLPEDAILEFAQADLMGDDGWAEATAGVDDVLHVASPVMPGHVEDESKVIVPAREGTLRVLRAARDAGVRRVVLTSAFHADSWGHPNSDHVFTEEDWTVLDGPGADAYARSKTIAERAAWQFVRDEAPSLELVTMLPVGVMGPVIGRDVSGANEVVLHMLTGQIPAFPHLFIPVVDVRDVAAAHVLALGVPGAAGQRFLLSNGPALELREIGDVVRQQLGERASRVPTRTLPNVVVRLGGLFSPSLRALVPDLGHAKATSNAKAVGLLGWTPRDPREAILAAAESMVAKGLVDLREWPCPAATRLGLVSRGPHRYAPD